jgi:hypothetical protein
VYAAQVCHFTLQGHSAMADFSTAKVEATEELVLKVLAPNHDLGAQACPHPISKSLLTILLWAYEYK